MSLTSLAEAGLVAAVRRAARDEILPRFRALPAADIRAKTAPDDLVTAADLAAEAAIERAVAQILPQAMVVGEEAVAADPDVLSRIAEAEWSVIVDPIDGTWNFAHGLATFGVILAVAQGGRTEMGLLYDPVMDDYVVARRGGGTWFVRPGQPPKRLHLAGDPPRAEAVGFFSPWLFPAAARPALAAAQMRFGRTWSLRCSCQEYRVLAQGGVDFGVAATLNPWDHAAGVLALEEAGGAVALLDGRPYAPTLTQGHLVVARSPALLEAVRTELAPLLEA